MSLGTVNRDGGKTSEAGHLRALYKFMAGEVLGGLAVSQRGAGANMSIDIAIGDAILPRSDATYGHPSFNDAVLNKTVTAADPSNPRRDIVIMYLDYTVTPSTGVSNNTNGVVLTKVVAGTPAGSPADPSDASLQAAAGSGNPYIKLARVRVGAGVTTIGNSVIDDLRTFAKAVDNGGWKPQAVAWDSWVYSAWDSTNKLGTITVPDSTLFTLGQKVRYWQTTGGWKYGFIVKLASSTSIIVYHGTDYTLNNERIYLPAISREKVPDGFPVDPTKWTIRVTDASLRSTGAPVLNTWYNPASLGLDVPIGVWNLRYGLNLFAQATSSGASPYATLSTANNSETDATMTSRVYVSTTGAAAMTSVGRQKTVVLTSNTRHYLNVKVDAPASTVDVYGTQATTVIEAVCAYL